MSKDSVLASIRAALADVPGDERADEVVVSRDYRDSHVDGDVVELFIERVTDYKATVSRCTEQELPREIDSILARRGVDSVVVPPGFPVEWLAGVAAPTRLYDDVLLTPAQLDAADGVITTAAAGIAVTGTIVLDGGPGQGRRALSLVPDFHLCVVRASQIAADVPLAVRGLDPVRPTTFISGPSATSDIELDRVEGVHGPRTLSVVVVVDS